MVHKVTKMFWSLGLYSNWKLLLLDNMHLIDMHWNWKHHMPNMQILMMLSKLFRGCPIIFVVVLLDKAMGFRIYSAPKIVNVDCVSSSIRSIVRIWSPEWSYGVTKISVMLRFQKVNHGIVRHLGTRDRLDKRLSISIIFATEYSICDFFDPSNTHWIHIDLFVKNLINIKYFWKNISKIFGTLWTKKVKKIY